MKLQIYSKTFAANKITSVSRKRLCNIAASLLFLPCANIAIAQTEPAGEQKEYTEVISVVGVRSSLEAAQQIKRLSNTVVEAITAVDIGQFSDDSIAGASNLTDDVRRDYVGAESTFLDVFAAGRSYSLSATYKF